MNYKKAYFTLFNQVTDAIELLKKAQIDSEEYCIHCQGKKKRKKPRSGSL